MVFFWQESEKREIDEKSEFSKKKKSRTRNWQTKALPLSDKNLTNEQGHY